MKTTYASLLFISAVLLSCEVKTAATVTSISEEKTKEVLEHHWKTFQANDLEGTMADYTEESVLITPDKTYSGLEEIRANFVNAFAVLPKDSTTMQLDLTVVKKDIGYIIWKASSPHLNITYGTDTFIIQNGKIISQTYAGVVAP